MVLGNIVGMLVSASAFAAIGMLISAMTESQIIACIVSYAVLLGLWLIGSAQSYITNEAAKALVRLAVQIKALRGIFHGDI